MPTILPALDDDAPASQVLHAAAESMQVVVDSHPDRAFLASVAELLATTAKTADLVRSPIHGTYPPLTTAALGVARTWLTEMTRLNPRLAPPTASDATVSAEPAPPVLEAPAPVPADEHGPLLAAYRAALVEHERTGSGRFDVNVMLAACRAYADARRSPAAEAVYEHVARDRAARWGYTETLDAKQLGQLISDQTNDEQLRADVDAVLRWVRGTVEQPAPTEQRKESGADVPTFGVDEVFPPAGTTAAVLDEVLAERRRQDVKFGEQNHRDGTGPEVVWAFTGPAGYVAGCARLTCQRLFKDGFGTWRDVLTEEVAEAYAEDDPVKLREELLQVAAVAVCWVESIDRRAVRAAG